MWHQDRLHALELADARRRGRRASAVAGHDEALLTFAATVPGSTRTSAARCRPCASCASCANDPTPGSTERKIVRPNPTGRSRTRGTSRTNCRRHARPNRAAGRSGQPAAPRLELQAQNDARSGTPSPAPRLNRAAAPRADRHGAPAAGVSRPDDEGFTLLAGRALPAPRPWQEARAFALRLGCAVAPPTRGVGEDAAALPPSLSPCEGDPPRHHQQRAQRRHTPTARAARAARARTTVPTPSPSPARPRSP